MTHWRNWNLCYWFFRAGVGDHSNLESRRLANESRRNSTSFRTSITREYFVLLQLLSLVLLSILFQMGRLLQLKCFGCWVKSLKDQIVRTFKTSRIFPLNSFKFTPNLECGITNFWKHSWQQSLLFRKVYDCTSFYFECHLSIQFDWWTWK